MRTSLFSHRIHRRGNGRRILSRSLTSLFVPVILAAGFGQSMPEVNGAVTATETSGALNVTLGAANDTGEILTFNSDTEFHVFGTGFGLQDFSGVTRINVALGSSNQVVTLDSTNASFEPSVNFSGGGATDTLVKAGGNTVILSSAATFGNTNLNGGTLEIGGGGTTGSISGNINISSSTADLVFARSNAITYSGIITGSGNVIQAGSGTLTLTGTNNFSGGIFIESGVVSVSNALALGAGHVTLDFGGELTATGTVTVTKEADFLSGVGKVSTSGTLTLNSVDIVGSSTMTVGSAGHTGTVVVGNGGMLASGASSIDVAFGTLANGGGLSALTQQASTTTVAAGAKLDLRDSSIEVQRLVNEGSVILGTKAATTLTIDAGAVDTAISGAGHVIVNGTVFYAGANTYTGGTTIFPGGQLFVGNGDTGSVVGNVVDNGALTFQRNGYTFAGQISGSGSVTITDGAVTLSGNNSYQGGTTTFDHLTITNGNALGTGDVTVNDGRELSATGTVTLANTVQAPNRSILSATGTFTIGSLELGTTSQLVVGSTGHTGTVVLANGGLAGMSPSATIDVAFGTLANGGRMNFFTDQAASTTVEAGATLDLRDGSIEVKNLQGAGSVKLGTQASTLLTIDAGTFSGVISGAGRVSTIGNVFLYGANTYTGGTTVPSGSELFIGNGATGSVAGNITLNDGSVSFDRTNSYTYAGLISGSGRVVVAGSSLTLTGNNTFAGGTIIAGNLLKITNANAIGTGPVTMSTFTELSTVGSFTLTNAVASIGPATLSTTGTFTVSNLQLASGAQFFAGSAGHTGTVVLGNGGSVMSNASTTLEVVFGTLANGGGLNQQTANASFTTVDAGATLDLRDGNIEIKKIAGAGTVKLGAQAATTLTLDAGTFSGVISGAGQVIDGGNVTLTGTNTYTGGTQAGNLHLGTGGTTGSIVGNVTINGSLTVDRSNAFTLAGLLSGAGSLTKQGAGLLTLTGNNSFSGGTTIQEGVISMSNGNALGTGSVTLDNGTELTTTGNFTLPNTIATTSGSAKISTTGTLTLGSLSLGAPIIFGSAGHTGTIVVSKTGAFTGVAGGTIDVAFGTLRDGNSLGTFTSFVNSTTVEAPATLDLNDQNVSIKNLLGAGKVKLGINSATALTLSSANFSGVISGAGHLNIAGNTTLAGASTYTGGTSITSGVATVRNTSGSATGTGAVAISSGASLGGTGHITGAVTLNSGGEIQPGQNTGAGSTLHLGPLLWNGGGTLGFDIGSVGDEVAIGGALTKGSAGQFTIDILNDGIGLTAHNFTLMTFTSSTFSLSDFQLELPANVTGTLVLTATSLQLQNLHDPPADRPLASGFTDSGSMADPIGTSTLSTDASAGSVLTASAESLVTAPTPEPTSILLLACGTLPVVARRRRM